MATLDQFVLLNCYKKWFLAKLLVLRSVCDMQSNLLGTCFQIPRFCSLYKQAVYISHPYSRIGNYRELVLDGKSNGVVASDSV